MKLRDAEYGTARVATSPVKVMAVIGACALLFGFGFVCAANAQQLGNITFPNSGAAAAQGAFLEGVKDLHSFQFDEAAVAFQKAEQIDPKFALAYWGEAMSHNHPLWAEVDVPGAKAAFEKLAATNEERVAKGGTEKEKAYLAAVNLLFYSPGDKLARDTAYSNALGKMYQRWPDDHEVDIFYALSLLGTVRPGDTGFHRQALAASICFKVYQENPSHPGAAHFIIHSFDDPDHAILALPAARAYSKIAPSAAHALHMPSHIYMRLGMWPDVVTSNVAAHDSAVALNQRMHLPEGREDFHTLAWLEYANLMLGKFDDAKKNVEFAKAADARNPGNRAVHQGYLEMRARYILETAQWENIPVEAPAANANGEGIDYARGADNGSWTFIAGLCAVKQGDLEAAAAAAKQLDTMRERTESGGNAYGAKQFAIMSKEIEAEAQLARGNKTEAVRLAKEAADIDATWNPPFGPTEPMKPALEFYGDVLMAAGQTKDAAAAYEQQLQKTPNRTPSVNGLARATKSSPRNLLPQFRATWGTASMNSPNLRRKLVSKKACALASVSAATVLVLANAALISRAQSPAASHDDGTPTIIAGPNMLVSRDGDLAHVELAVAANPLHPKNLVSGAITATRAEGGWACKAYSSQNGGDTWLDVVLPEQHTSGGGDPQVAFGPHGTAYFAALSDVKDDLGHTRSGVLFYRSEDGGANWGKPANLGYSYDHDVIAVDQSKGQFAGRIYVSVLYGYPVYRVGVFRSDDDGRTFTGPVEAVNGGGTIGINTAANIMVLHDGTLIIPYEDFEFLPEKRKTSHTGTFWFVASTDGGITFSAPHKIATQEYDRDPDAPQLTTFPAFAADDAAESKYKGRLYTTWTDFRDKKYRVLYAFSADRGNTWSEPKQIDTGVADALRQFQPMVAVNRDGTVGVTWYDTRNSKNNESFDEYFSASLDGGATFLPAIKISAYSSLLPGDGNLRLDAQAWEYKGEKRLTFLSAASRWGIGGDYIGLTADANGIFHPLWADSRTGTFQIQTARVEVKKAAPEKSAAEKSAAATAEPAKVQTDITSKIEFVFDPSKYNGATHEVEIPIRVKNISDVTITGPIVATVSSFGSGEGEEDRENSPEILNADNGKKGVGATFNFSAVLGGTNSLPADAVSGALVWKLRLSKPLRTPDLHMTLTGLVPQTK